MVWISEDICEGITSSMHTGSDMVGKPKNNAHTHMHTHTQPSERVVEHAISSVLRGTYISQVSERLAGLLL